MLSVFNCCRDWLIAGENPARIKSRILWTWLNCSWSVLFGSSSAATYSSIFSDPEKAQLLRLTRGIDRNGTTRDRRTGKGKVAPGPTSENPVQLDCERPVFWTRVKSKPGRRLGQLADAWPPGRNWTNVLFITNWDSTFVKCFDGVNVKFFRPAYVLRAARSPFRCDKVRSGDVGNAVHLLYY